MATLNRAQQREKHLRDAEECADKRTKLEQDLRFGRVKAGEIAEQREEIGRLTASIADHYAAAFELEDVESEDEHDEAWWGRLARAAAVAELETARERAEERQRRAA